jgi:hypothetical protein
MTEVQQADPRTRRITLICLVAAAGLGGGALILLERYRQWLLSWFMAQEPAAQVCIIVTALLFLVVPLLLMGAWLWSYGVRVHRENRHPPEGVKVIRDTPVIHGAAARLHARLYQGLAALFVFAALFVMWVSSMLWRVR